MSVDDKNRVRARVDSALAEYRREMKALGKEPVVREQLAVAVDAAVEAAYELVQAHHA